MSALPKPAALVSPGTSIAVTRPLLPSFDALEPYLRGVLERGWLTNDGPLARQLGAHIAEICQGEAVLVANGTSALDLMLDALAPPGDVLVTAYSFPATYHAVLRNPKWRAVFVDIDDDFGMNPEAAARAITPTTRAILAVHPYGYPCQVDALEHLARAHDIPLLFDAAPAFGVTLDGRSIAQRGHASAFSFHATKVFSTVEGGCIVTRRAETARALRLLRNFGIEDEDTVSALGTNAKLDELRAAFGLASLPLLPRALLSRRRVVQTYLAWFAAHPHPQVQVFARWHANERVRHNYAYFPMRLASAAWRERVFSAMRARGVGVRKYYHPSAATAPIYRPFVDPSTIPKARAASETVLCLPVYPQLSDVDLQYILRCLGEVLHG